MKRWVQYEEARAGDDYIWDGDFQFGDWLDFGSENRNRFGATNPSLVASAYLAHSADIVRRTAGVLGRREDVARFGALYSRVTDAFRRKFVSDDGRVGEGTQAAYVLALDFDLLPEQLRVRAAAKLAKDVRQRGHLTTGFLGTAHLLTVLSRYGYLEEAYRLLNRSEFPSWLYPVRHGATTMWERWDGIKPDGSFQDKSINSFNHYAYGSIGEWMYQVMAGIRIDPDAPGYRHILIEPQPGGGFTRVYGSHETPYGRVSAGWTAMNGMFTLMVEVPPNTHATVRLPNARLERITESGTPLRQAAGVANARQEDAAVTADVGSGNYQFAYATGR
jgi:alpha-L-rhamnosidase